MIYGNTVLCLASYLAAESVLAAYFKHKRLQFAFVSVLNVFVLPWLVESVWPRFHSPSRPDLAMETSWITGYTVLSALHIYRSNEVHRVHGAYLLLLPFYVHVMFNKNPDDTIHRLLLLSHATTMLKYVVWISNFTTREVKSVAWNVLTALHWLGVAYVLCSDILAGRHTWAHFFSVVPLPYIVVLDDYIKNNPDIQPLPIVVLDPNGSRPDTTIVDTVCHYFPRLADMQMPGLEPCSTPEQTHYNAAMSELLEKDALAVKVPDMSYLERVQREVRLKKRREDGVFDLVQRDVRAYGDQRLKPVRPRFMPIGNAPQPENTE